MYAGNCKEYNRACIIYHPPPKKKKKGVGMGDGEGGCGHLMCTLLSVEQGLYDIMLEMFNTIWECTLVKVEMSSTLLMAEMCSKPQCTQVLAEMYRTA